MGACIQCIPGSTARQNASSECEMCEPGRFSSFPGHKDVCEACRTGTSQPFEGATSCSLCIPGQHQPGKGQIMCKDCDIGRFSSDEGTKGDCTACPKGFYQMREKRASCDSCRPGFYQKSNTSSSCDECPSGYFSLYPRAVSCKPCEIGKDTAGIDGAVRCHDCMQGSAGGGHRSLCKLCVPGK